MEAQLEGDGAFAIAAVTPLRQPVSRTAPTEWRWSVRANEKRDARASPQHQRHYHHRRRALPTVARRVRSPHHRGHQRVPTDRPVRRNQLAVARRHHRDSAGGLAMESTHEEDADACHQNALWQARRQGAVLGRAIRSHFKRAAATAMPALAQASSLSCPGAPLTPIDPTT